MAGSIAIDTRERTVHAQQIDTPSILAEQFDDWYIWRSTDDNGIPRGWCATHKTPLTRSQEQRGMCRTLVEDNPERLVAELHRQIAIKAKL